MLAYLAIVLLARKDLVFGSFGYRARRQHQLRAAQG